LSHGTRQYNLPEWIVHAERTIYGSRRVKLGLADVSLPSGERFEHDTVTAAAAIFWTAGVSGSHAMSVVQLAAGDGPGRMTRAARSHRAA
jgi:hypothetical protein